MKNLILRVLPFFGLMIGLFMIAATQSQAAEYEPILGDANCDSRVTATDALTALRASAGLVEYSDCASLADVDCDTDVDAVDGLKILRFVAGLPNANTCAPGKPVPPLPAGEVLGTLSDEQGNVFTVISVVSEEDGAQVGSGDPSGIASLAYSYYRSCWAETYVKNVFGAKVAWLRHNQSFMYNGLTVTTVFQPYRQAGSYLGWDVDNMSTSGPYMYDYWRWGRSWSSARFKFVVAGITIQSYWVNAGLDFYGTGACYGWR